MDMWHINQSDILFSIKPNIHYFILSLPIQPTQPLFSPIVSTKPYYLLHLLPSYPTHPTFILSYLIQSTLFSPRPSPFLSNPPNPILSCTFSLPIQPTQPYSLLHLLPLYPTHPTFFLSYRSHQPYSLLHILPSYPTHPTFFLSYTFTLSQ